MRKSAIAIGIAAVFTAPAFLMAGGSKALSPRQQPDAPLHVRAHSTTPAAAVLYDQSGTIATVAQTLHDSTAPTFDSEGADDFIVTDATGWTVTQLNAQVAFLNSGSPSPVPSGTVYDVTFYADNAGAPAATPVPGCAYGGLAGTLDAAQNNLQVPLIPACRLDAGTYWVALAPNYHFPPQGFWAMESGAAINAAARWRNPGAGYGTPCTSWSPLSACTGFAPDNPIGGGNRNFLFQVVGSVNGNGGCGSGGICLQVGLAPADASHPNLCGTATALDVTAGDQVNYCYKVTNQSGLALGYQSLSDNVNGALLNLSALALPAGGSLQYNRVVTASASQSVISAWTAQDQLPGYAFGTGNLNPGTPGHCDDRLFADGFDGTPLPCGGTPGDFIDISATGTSIDPGDDASVAATLPFSFNLYGQSSNQLCVGNNGYILFATSTCPTQGLWDNQPLPSSDLPATAILPFWDDLYRGGHVYTAAIGSAPNRKFVVEWYQKNHAHGGANDAGGVTFEVVFGEDGSLRFNYLKSTFESDPSWDNGASATIGLQKNATLANTFSFGQPSLHAQFYVAATAANPSVFTSTDNGVSVNVGVPQIQLSPTALAGSATAGASTTATLGIGNSGTRALNWTVAEAPAAHLPPLGSRYAFPMGAANGADAHRKEAVVRQRKAQTAANRPLIAGVPAFAVMPEAGAYAPAARAVNGGHVDLVRGGGFVNGRFDTQYLLGDDGLKKIDTATGALTTINAATGDGDVWAATIDPSSGAMYYVGGTAQQTLYRIDDLASGHAAAVAAIGGSAEGHLLSAIAADAGGRLWGIDKTQDTLVAIDKRSGATSLIGSLGIDTEGVATLAFDAANGTLYLAALNAARNASTMYALDLVSGAATVIAPLGDGSQHLTALAIAAPAAACSTPADVPWLSLAPSSGSTPAAGSVPVTATLNAASLSAGVYHANVCVSSNDPAHALVAVPVDFTVNATIQAPSLSKAFAPASVVTGQSSRLTIALTNTNATPATLTAGLVDHFPAGLVVAATPNAATTCPGGSAAAAAGDAFVSLSGGGPVQIPANGSCTLAVDVVGATAGSYVNEIPAGALLTDAGFNAAPAQATLTVTAPAAPTLAKAFAPASVVVNASSTLTITLSNPNATSATLSAALTDTFPSGLVVAATPNTSTTCGGSVTAAAGGSSVGLAASGAAIPANGSCTVKVDVTSAATGSYANTLAAGALQTSAGSNAAPAGATLTVTATPVAPTLAKAFAPASVAVSTPSTLTITLSNSNATSATLSTTLTDTFPSGLVVAATPNASTTCGGSVTAAAGSGSISLGASGAAIPANGSCIVKVDVTAAATGSYANTIAAGALQTNAGSNPAAASATLSVSPAPPPSCPTQNFDAVTAPALPAGWTFSSGGGSGTFTTVSTVSDTAPNSAFAPNLTAPNDIRLDSPAFVPAVGSMLTFRNRYNLENGFDGAVLEISINGAAFQDILGAGGGFVAGGYNGTLSTNATFQNPLVGRKAWTGTTNNVFTTTSVTFPPAAVGQSTKLRFRTGDDNATTASGTPGWWIDSLSCGAAPPVVAKSFAPANGAVGAISTLTIALTHPAGPATLTSSLVDSLPAGLVVAPTPNASTTCTSGTASASAGGSSVTLSSGAVIPAAGCQVNVDVTTSAPGIYVNTIAAGALKTGAGNNAFAATANYQATQAGFVTYATGFEPPAYSTGALNGQQSWYASVPADWTVSAAHPGAGVQHARGTWSAAGASTDTTFMLSPDQAYGTTAYSSASAKLSISVTGSGANWEFSPQDPVAGSVITRVRFANTGNKIQVLVPNGGSAVYTDTGATWTPGAYFDVKLVAKRADKTYELCLNGSSIWSGTGFAANIANVAMVGYKGTGTQNNVLDVDEVVIDNVNDGGCTTTAPQAPTLAKAFAPATVAAGSSSTLTITLSNSNATAATLGAALTDTFPNGLVVAATPNASTTCGGNVTATAGSGSVSLAATGAVIPANGSCTLNVDVTAANAGSYANTIAAGALQTSAGNNASAAAATLTVTAAAVAPTLTASFAPKTHVDTSAATTLTLTLGNANATAATLSAALVDTLPNGLVVAATPNAATTCTGGAVTAAAGAASFSLAGGAQIPANAACTVKVDLQSANAGVYTNTVPAGSLQTDAGSNASDAADNVVVAGAFPAPYCSATFSNTREPITRVDFAGISNTSSASTTGAVAMENFLAVGGGAVAPRGGYTITVKGNTNGNFQDFFNVFFDWNHDGQFATDGSESANIGSITNSTGTDTAQTSGLVIVPPTARPGLTRMRVVKAYGNYGSVCGDSGFGQSEDYLVLVDPSLIPPPTPPQVAKAFSQTYFAAPGGVSTLTITLTNYNATPLALSAAFTDTFPSGLVVAATPNAATTCVGNLTANAGAGLVRLASGTQIPAIGSCTVKVDVTSASAGVYVNTIAAGAAQSANGGNPNPASATVQFASTSGVPNYSTGFESPFTVGNLNGQQGWLGQGGSPLPQVANATPASGLQYARMTSTADGGATGTQPLVLSPIQNVGTAPYSSLSAKIRLSRTSNGASWELDPQDSSSGLVATRLMFDRGTSRDIKVITYPSGTFTSIGTWPTDTYFSIKVVIERATGAMKVCMNGAQIYDDPNGASVAGKNITDMAVLQVKGTGQSASNTLFLDDVAIDNPGAISCSGP